MLLIITEASPVIGHGHVMRCCALAEASRRCGVPVRFLAHDTYTDALLQAQGQQLVAQMPADTRCIIRDLRDGSDEQQVAAEEAAGLRVLLLDEQGPARCRASLVSDSLMTEARRGYFAHGGHTRYLYGLDYAPLRPAFAESPNQTAGIGLLIALGGGDSTAITNSYVQALDAHGYHGPATVVCGGGEGERQALAATLARWQDSELLTSSNHMAELMNDSALVVTKLGMTQLEAFARGRPVLLIEPGEAHLKLSRELAAHYADWPALELGLAEGLDYEAAAECGLALLGDTERLVAMSRRAAQLVDGRGSERMIDALLTAVADSD